MNKEKSIKYNEALNKLKKADLETYSFEIEDKNIREEIYYVLAMFPYPSWAGLHIWHALNYTIWDVAARFKRMQWKKVLYPNWWDAFWLPTEWYALKKNLPATTVTKDNIEKFKLQSQKMNWSYDRWREINTSSPEFYKWTQRLFIKLQEAGLVYQKEWFVNRDPIDKTVLANDQVLSDWTAERSWAKVIQKKHLQRYIKITDYAEKLEQDLKDLDWPESVKNTQREWIWRRDWYNITFQLAWSSNHINVFFKEIEEINDVEKIIVFPEYEGLNDICQNNFIDIDKFTKKALSKSLMERKKWTEKKEVTIWNVVNPINWKKIPIILSDFLSHEYSNYTDFVLSDIKEEDRINRDTILIKLSELGIAQTSEFRLRDWSISRQRYRWAPLPVVYDQDWNTHFLNEEQLPVLLPKNLKPEKPSGISPLAWYADFKETNINNQLFERECDTADSFLDSSFYYLRFLDNKNTTSLIDKNIAEKISNVDLYIWWSEHTCWHLLYARFIHKFLFDHGFVNTSEPFKKLFNQWMILAEDWTKMSKRKWNTIDPIKLVKEKWLDELRITLMSMWPLDKDKARREDSLIWTTRFLNKIDKISNTIVTEPESENVINYLQSALKKITLNMENLKYNNVIAWITEILNKLLKQRKISIDSFKTILSLIYPFAPKTSLKYAAKFSIEHNELMKRPNKNTSIDLETWEKLLMTCWFCINWKRKSEVTIPKVIDNSDILNYLKVNFNKEYLKIDNMKVNKIIYIPGRILNIVCD